MSRVSKKTALRSVAILVTITSIYLFAPWEFALYYLKPTSNNIEQELASAVAERIDGVILYVDQSAKEPERYAEGFHNKAEEISAYPSALFKIGSIGKLYDASAVAKLVASDRLSLDKTLADYLPEVSERIEHADQITVRMLVQHQSGIPNFTDDEAFDWADSSLDDIELILGDPADFEPGTDYGYSNTNYYLLRQIMTRVLGYHYGEFVKAEILAPLELNNTYMSVNDVEPKSVMSGYYVGYQDDFKYLDQGMVSTADDVGQFLRALNTGLLFTQEEAEIYNTLYQSQHDGWVLGYWSRARYYADIDTVVVQFVNTTGDDTLLLSQIVYGRIVDIIRNR